MKNDAILIEIKDLIVKGESEKIFDLVNEAVKGGIGLKDILNESIIKGAEEVGDLYEKDEYFLPDMLLSGDALINALSVLEELFPDNSDIASNGRILIGTVEGDVHDIGKNLVVTLLKGKGFEVIDLGKDISPEKFLENAKQTKPLIIGLSGLLTMSISKMRETINLLKKEGIDAKIVVGGGILSKESCEMIGADEFAKDGWEGMKKIMNLVKNEKGRLE